MSHSDTPEAAAWQRVIAAREGGDVLEGQVVSVVPFGAFVELGPGLHGLLHKSEWRTQPEPGTTVAVNVLDVDADKRRFSLREA